MKKIILFFPLVLNNIICLPQQGANCLPDGAEFTSQAQIDSFKINYPGCKGIDGDVTISGSDITDLIGLNVLTSIRGTLSILDNESLAGLTGLEGLNYVMESIIIKDNNALTNLTGLDNVTSLGGGLSIKNNDALLSLTGLESLTSITFGLGIWENDALTDLTGLENLTSVKRGVEIRFNSSLTSLSALGGLSEILRFGITIDDNDSLTCLTGLENITFGYSGGIGIFDNNTLIDISALENLSTQHWDDIMIWNNNSLSYCHIESICNVLLNPNPWSYISIHDNATGCNSKEEVEDSCGLVGIRTKPENLGAVVFPNPFTTSTTFEYTLQRPENVHFTIYNLQGQVVDRIQERQDKGVQRVQWNAEGLPAGLYIMRLQAGNNNAFSKLLLAH